MICHCDQRRGDASSRWLAAPAATPARPDEPMIVVQADQHTSPTPSTATLTQLAPVWHVVVLNDPVNLMSYVVMVFKKVFGYDEPRARRHMLEVHEQGRSVVWTGGRERAEAYVFTLQQWHLTAVLEADEAR